MKEIFIKNWKTNSLLGLYLSEDIPNFTNNDISKINMRCNICRGELWKDMAKKIDLSKELHVLVRVLKQIEEKPRD